MEFDRIKNHKAISKPLSTAWGLFCYTVCVFEEILDAGWFSADIVGAQVTDTNEHNWRIIKAGDDYYDLWYEETIGDYVFTSSYYGQINCFWSQSQLRTNLNGSLFYNNTAKLPTAMKNRVIDKEVNAGWINNGISLTAGGTNRSTDKVWLLTVTEIGGKTVSPTLNDWVSGAITVLNNSGDDGEEYNYFLDDINNRLPINNGGRIRGSFEKMWLITGMYFPDYNYAYFYNTSSSNGSFDANSSGASRGVVPAVRVQ